MYKVFLVDDEIVIREGIRNNVRWEEHDLQLCGEAPDSEIALSMIQDLKPDILITDIRMPFMDGLELCRRVTRTMPWVHIVILSGHDDFAYAREAISLGVKEYLLKPVSSTELEKVLMRIAGDIEQERAQQADISALKRQLESSSRLIKEGLILKLLDGANEQEVLGEARKLRVNLSANHYLAMLVGLTEQSGLLPVRGALERVADSYGGAVHLCARGGRLCILVMGDTEGDLEERAYAFAQAIKHEVERQGDLRLRVSIGEPVRALSALPRSLRSAGAILSSMVGDGQILGSADMGAASVPELPHIPATTLYEQLQYVDLSDLPGALSAYMDSLGEAALSSTLMIHYVVMDMLLTASRIVKQSGGNPSGVLPEVGRIAQLVTEIHSQKDILLFAESMFGKAISFRDTHGSARHSASVRKACQFIEANYQKPEIMLRDVAEHVALSNNHFCTVFSQEMGITFIEYLTRLRMEKAKELLKASELSSGEISDRVGYNDPHYFRYLFKKHVGMNPRDYRSSCRR